MESKIQLETFPILALDFSCFIIIKLFGLREIILSLVEGYCFPYFQILEVAAGMRETKNPKLRQYHFANSSQLTARS